MRKIIKLAFCTFLLGLVISACNDGGSASTATADKLTVVGSGS